jgi:hypothetical protein
LHAAEDFVADLAGVAHVVERRTFGIDRRADQVTFEIVLGKVAFDERAVDVSREMSDLFLVFGP